MLVKIKYFLVFISAMTAVYNNAYTNILNRIDNKLDNSIRCIENIIGKYFPCGTLMTLVNLNIMHADNLIKAISNNSCNSLIIRSFEEKDWLISTDVYIVASKNKINLISGISHLRRDLLWNPRAKFIVLIQQLKVEDILEVFKMFNYYKIYNVVLLLRGKYDINTLIYTYYPFASGACNNNFQNAISLGQCQHSENISSIFQNEIPYNIENCTFNVIASEDTPNFIFDSSNFTVFGEHILGIEQYVLRIFADFEKVRFKFILKPKNYTYGFVLENGTATGLLRFLQNNKADIAAGGLVLIKNRITMFDYTWGLNFASYRIFTPTTDEVVWADVYKEFNLHTWLLIYLIYCIIFITFAVKRNTMSKNYGNHSNIAMKLFGYLYGNPSTKLPNYKSMRIVLVWWIWFTFFIANFYTTAMFSLITRRIHIQKQTNPDKLDELSYKPCIANKTRTFLIFTYNKTLPEDENNSFCQESEANLDLIASRKDLYTIDMEYTYKLNEHKFIDEEGFPKLDSVKFHSQHTTAFYYSRGFAFRDRINKYVTRLTEMGLLESQRKNILEHGQITRHPHSKKSFKTMKIPDFIFHYYILLGGYIISLVLFLIEIILFKIGVNNQTITI